MINTLMPIVSAVVLATLSVWLWKRGRSPFEGTAAALALALLAILAIALAMPWR